MPDFSPLVIVSEFPETVMQTGNFGCHGCSFLSSLPADSSSFLRHLESLLRDTWRLSSFWHHDWQNCSHPCFGAPEHLIFPVARFTAQREKPKCKYSSSEAHPKLRAPEHTRLPFTVVLFAQICLWLLWLICGVSFLFLLL